MNKILTVVILLMVVMGIVFSAQTSISTNNGPYREARVQMVTCTLDNDWPYTSMNDLTLTTGHIQGTVVRIGYDSTGTDIEWGCVLKDTMGVTIFSKTDCNSLTEPLAYTIYEDDTEGNPHRGVAVSGYLSLDIDDVAQQAEVQTATAAANADAGTYNITIDGETTSTLAYDANIAFIEVALEALSNIDTDGITTVVSTLDAGHDTPIVVTFNASLGNVPSMVFADVADSNSGAVAVVETTKGGNLFSELLVYIWYEQ